MTDNVKLKITDITWNGGNQVKPGTSVVFTVTMKNEGTEELLPAVQQTVIQLHIDRAEPVWFRYDGGLKVGESKTFDFPVWEAVEGNHAITATINFAMPSPTTWESGMVFVKYLRVAEKALEVPSFAAAAGMNTLAFNDDFTTLDTIDVNATGKVGYHWYVTRPYAATNVTPEDYELTKDGLLLHLHKSTFNYGLAMVDARTGAGWGYKHGYMECRFKVASNRIIPDTKGSPAIWAMPAERYWCYTDHWLEMDHMEYWGNQFGDQKMYTVTMHEQSCEYGNGNPTTKWIKNDKTCFHYGLDDDDWHTMGWLWEEGSLTTYVDGKQIMQQKWGGADGEPELKVVNGELGEAPFTVFDKYSYPVTISGAYGWPMEVDFLTIWQK